MVRPSLGDPSLVDQKQPIVPGPDPKATVPVAQKMGRREPTRVTRNRVGFQLAIDELLELVVHGDEGSTAVALGDGAQIGRERRVAFWRTRLPLPQPGHCTR